MPVISLGDFDTTETIYPPFNTYDSDGASVTISGLAVTDIEIYKNGNTTQRASDNGYALLDTDGVDFDGSTGLHGFSVDLSDNSDAGFYSDGAQYWLHIDAITVDSQTVRFTYYFTIGRTLRPSTAGRTLGVDGNGRTDIGSWNGTAVATPDTAGYPVVTIKDGTGQGEVSLTSGAVDNVGTVATNSDMRGTDSAALASVCTEARLSELDAATPGKAANQVDEIRTDTEDLQAQIGTAGVGLTNLGGMSTGMKAEVNAECDTAVSDYDGPTNAEMTARTLASASYATAASQTTMTTHLTDVKGAGFSGGTDSLEAIRNRGDAAWTTGSGTGLTALASGTAQGGTTVTIQLAGSETFSDDELNGGIVKIHAGTGAGQTRLITAYVGATDTATVTPSWATTPDNTSQYEIVESGGVDVVLQRLARIPMRNGVIYYVNSGGDDDNNGLNPVDDAWLTMGYADGQLSAGDMLVVGDGDYNEAVVIAVRGVTVEFEPGAVVKGGAGVPLTLSAGADYTHIHGGVLSPTDAGNQAGLSSVADDAVFTDVCVITASDAFSPGLRNRLVNCRSLAHFGKGLKLSASHVTGRGLHLAGAGSGQTGISIEGGGHHAMLFDVVTTDNDTAIASVSAGGDTSSIVVGPIYSSVEEGAIDDSGDEDTASFPGATTGRYNGITFESLLECLLAATTGATVPNKIQYVTITGSPTGGTFTLTLAAQETGNIAYDATAATVKAALEALSNVGSDNVGVSGDAGGPWTVTFGAALDVTDLAPMTADGTLLTGGAAPDVEIDTTVSFLKRDGSTSKVTIRYTAREGERTGSTIDN